MHVTRPEFAIRVTEKNHADLCTFMHFTLSDPDAPTIGQFALFTDHGDGVREFEFMNEKEFLVNFDIDPYRHTDEHVTDTLAFFRIHKF